jgi:hypothetical protein
MKTLSKFREKLIALFGSVVISLGCFSSPAVAQLEGVPVLGDLTSLIDAGGLGGTITSLTATIELGQITTLTEDAGFNGLFFSNGGLDGVLDLVLDIGSGILGGGGIGAVPLIGSDLDILASVDGFQAGKG